MYRFEVSQKARKFVRFFWPLIRGWVRFRDNIRSTLWSEESGSRRIFFRYFGRAQKLSDIGFFVLLWLISLYFVTTTCQLIHPSVFSSWQKTSMIERVSKIKCCWIFFTPKYETQQPGSSLITPCVEKTWWELGTWIFFWFGKVNWWILSSLCI